MTPFRTVSTHEEEDDAGRVLVIVVVAVVDVSLDGVGLDHSMV
jgi:hypothetical protein